MLKTIVLTFILALSAQAAFASLPTRNDHWNTILASSDLVNDLPQVWFGTTAVPASGVCKHGEYLETIYPVAVCGAGSENFGMDFSCVPASSRLSVEITKMYDICDAYDVMTPTCVGNTHQELRSIPLTYKNVNVYLRGEALIEPTSYGPKLFQKDFTISDCQ